MNETIELVDLEPIDEVKGGSSLPNVPVHKLVIDSRNGDLYMGANSTGVFWKGDRVNP